MEVRKPTKEEKQAYHKAYHREHAEKIRKRANDWYYANKERASKKAKEYRELKGDELKAKKLAYYKTNREKIRAQQNANHDPLKAYARVKAWRKANPEKYKKLYTRDMNKRRALKLATQVGEVDYEAIITRDNGDCGICKLPIEGKFEYDHIIPLSKNGPHITENLQVAHPSCNRKKSSKLTIQ
jgi:5-methylcytosine-specific restriction endonuclease McrA